jgi:ribosomal-protein-alanine N-acetyltransferase
VVTAELGRHERQRRGERGGQRKHLLHGFLQLVSNPQPTATILSNVELTTSRLILRRWRDEDRDPFAALNADPKVMEYFVAPLTREQSDDMVDRIEAHFDSQGWGLWAVEVKETQQFIGFTGLWPPNWQPELVEIGWRLAHDAWGHGYATEAARAALEVGFDRLGLAEIVSFTAVDNIRSQRVMQKIGMTRDPADDFDHPNVPDGHPLKRHVFYRARR